MMKAAIEVWRGKNCGQVDDEGRVLGTAQVFVPFPELWLGNPLQTAVWDSGLGSTLTPWSDAMAKLWVGNNSFYLYLKHAIAQKCQDPELNHNCFLFSLPAYILQRINFMHLTRTSASINLSIHSFKSTFFGYISMSLQHGQTPRGLACKQLYCWLILLDRSSDKLEFFIVSRRLLYGSRIQQSTNILSLLSLSFVYVVLLRNNPEGCWHSSWLFMMSERRGPPPFSLICQLCAKQFFPFLTPLLSEVQRFVSWFREVIAWLETDICHGGSH